MGSNHVRVSRSLRCGVVSGCTNLAGDRSIAGEIQNSIGIDFLSKTASDGIKSESCSRLSKVVRHTGYKTIREECAMGCGDTVIRDWIPSRVNAIYVGKLPGLTIQIVRRHIAGLIRMSIVVDAKDDAL